ncbi:MAG TPA: hypothetical protein VHX36_05965 [Candidatus Acidoferrales bacterium]|nr:hypothetical protein [Candidatus Acidoferrales bacterium]
MTSRRSKVFALLLGLVAMFAMSGPASAHPRHHHRRHHHHHHHSHAK